MEITDTASAILRAESNLTNRKLRLQNQEGTFKSHVYFKNGETLTDLDGHSVVPNKYEWNYRSIADNEIPIDIDYDACDKEIVRQVVILYCKILDKNNINYELYDSGGKGFHIHIFFTELALYNEKQRLLIRQIFLQLYHYGMAIDKQVVSENRVFGLEYAKHRNSGKPKSILINKLNGQNSNLPLVIKDYLEMLTMTKLIRPVKTSHVVHQFSKTETNGMPACITAIRSIFKQVPDGVRDEVMFKLARFYKFRLSYDDALKELQAFMTANGYNESSAGAKLNSAKYPLACGDMIEMLTIYGLSMSCKNCPNNVKYSKSI